VDRRTFLKTVIPATVGIGGTAAVGAATFRIEGVERAVGFEQPAHEWSLDIAERSDTPESGRVTALDAVDDAVARALRASVDGEPGLDDVPAGLKRVVETYDWITGFADGKAYSFTLAPLFFEGESPLSVSLDLVDAKVTPGNPGLLRFSVHNRSTRPQTVSAGYHPPFGALYCHEVSGDGGFSLYTPEDLPTHIFDITRAVPTPGTLSLYEPGETVERFYQIRAGDRSVQPGTYTTSGSFGFGVNAPQTRDRPDGERTSIRPASGGYWSVEWRLGLDVVRPNPL
jgi:hypothetical protein